ncbi:phosphopantetheine adenylyltransferase [Candidatus Bathyarchaeota archaeon]|nr:MAG: phosphopantetheine adenylyltransferase [Candidatus Bathyarchaeota archaeon]
MDAKRLGVVCVGGTFDRLHRGHEALLLRAFEVGEKVVIGVSSDAFVGRMQKGHEVQPYEERVEEVRRFLREKGLEGRTIFVPLEDPYGPAVTDEGIEGIVVSEETAPVAEEINEIRRQRGMRPLEVFRIETVLAEDGRPISSTRIRLGEIDRRGRILRRG